MYQAGDGGAARARAAVYTRGCACSATHTREHAAHDGRRRKGGSTRRSAGQRSTARCSVTVCVAHVRTRLHAHAHTPHPPRQAAPHRAAPRRATPSSRQAAAYAVDSFRYSIRSLRSPSFFRPAKIILVPLMYLAGSSR